LTGDLGSANLMRKMAFDNIERKKQGLEEIEYTPAQKKKAFMEAYISTMKIVNYLRKFTPVFTIFGNVESSNSYTKKESKKIGVALPYLSSNLNALSNVRIINNRIANFREIKIGGLEYFVDSSWIREFKPNDYQDALKNAKKETEKAKRVLRRFGENLDVLICHQPPYGVLDKVTSRYNPPKLWQGKHAGSKVILNYIKKYQPKYVFCGHIHEGEGKTKIGKTEVYNLGVAGHKIIELD
jgi:Icc-related predicted phosphoesterase